MSRASVWEAVAQIVNSGQAPRIRLNPAAEVHPAKRKSRKGIRDNANPFAHYATPKRGLQRPRCLMCRRKLRVRDVEVCSKDCADRFVCWARTKIDRIENKVIRIPLTDQAAKHIMGVAS